MRRLLLISNSTQHGSGYLEHCGSAISTFLGDVREVLFVPFALADRDVYADKAAARFEEMGFTMRSLHREQDPSAALRAHDAVFVGGGNTFRLLSTLQTLEILPLFRERVLAGMRYIGSSAGSVISAPTLKTTNDMPIVQPRSFHALELVPFQINAHFIDADPESRHMGETRETRIREFHEMNESAVVGLREGSWISVDGDRATLEGTTGAKLFVKGEEPRELDVNADLSFLMTDGNR